MNPSDHNEVEQSSHRPKSYKSKSPPKNNVILRFLGMFLYSLTPFIYWGGMGFLNDYYFNFSEDLTIFLVLPGFVPFFLAKKLGYDPSTIFLLTASYPVIGFIIMWTT